MSNSKIVKVKMFSKLCVKICGFQGQGFFFTVAEALPDAAWELRGLSILLPWLLLLSLSAGLAASEAEPVSQRVHE